MEIQFLPLELWRASSLAQETKTVIAAYERCLASGDVHGLQALRRAIERRIDDLESFYLSHVDDEKSVLFEKQRLKLRKLLHEYDSVMQPSATNFGGVHTPAPGADRSAHASPAGASRADGLDAGLNLPHSMVPRGDGMISRDIREDSRLNATELLAWFVQAGIAEMPEVPPEVVEKVFNNVTKTNLDGKMSIRDLRQWYITFGKKALRENLPLDDIVSVGFVRSTSGAAVSARKENVHKKDTLELLSSGYIPAGTPAQVALASATNGPRKPLYAWEVAAAGTPGAPATTIGATPADVPMSLPNGVLEFQVRLTPEEFMQVTLKRRMMDAELKYKERINAAKDKAAMLRGEQVQTVVQDDVETPLHYNATSLLTAGPYEDPIGKAFFYRSP